MRKNTKQKKRKKHEKKEKKKKKKKKNAEKEKEKKWKKNKNAPQKDLCRKKGSTPRTRSIWAVLPDDISTPRKKKTKKKLLCRTCFANLVLATLFCQPCFAISALPTLLGEL